MARELYDLEVNSLDDQPVSFDQYRGKVLLVCNTASHCGFTPQYKGLEALHRKYHEQGLEVLGFPSSQFHQELAGNEEIQNFCVRNYGVTFQLFAKSHINGEQANPVFKYLQDSAPGLFGSSRIKWNFTKFLVNREGVVIGRYSPLYFPRFLEGKIQALL